MPLPGKECLKNILKLAGFCLLAGVAILSAFPLVFVPGDCASSPGFCALWDAVALMMILPFYLAFAALFMSCAESPRMVRMRKILWRAIPLMPAAGSAFYWMVIIFTGGGDP